MITGSQSVYYFEGNNVYRQNTTTHKVGLTKDALRGMSDLNGITVRQPLEGIDYFSVSKQGIDTYTYYTTQLKSVRINTYYEPYTGEVFGEPDNWPAMKASFARNDGAIKKDLLWTPPTYMKLFFVSSFIESESDGILPYLLCKIGDELHRPPLPNIYDDSRICMGYEFSDDTNLSKIDRHKRAFDFFHSTDWNSDLLSDQTQYLLFNSEDGCFHPSKETYQSHLPIISTSRLSWAVDL